jgi:hypothetical protein
MLDPAHLTHPFKCPTLARMCTEDIGTVAMEAFERIDPDAST